MCWGCCSNRVYIDLTPITERLDAMNCTLEQLNSAVCSQSTELRIIRQTLTAQMPFVAKAEYPTVVDNNRIVYTLQGSDQPFGITFRDYVLGPLDIYFAGKVPDILLVYIKDASNYEHQVTAPGTNDPLKGVSDALVNKLLPATYEGNYIHLT